MRRPTRGTPRPGATWSGRIAALAGLCAEHLHTGLFNHFLRLVNTARPAGRQRADTAVRRALLGPLLRLEHPYWSRRCTFGGKRLARPSALVGRQRAMGILADVLLPMLLAHSRRENDAGAAGKLHELWRGLPRQEGNVVTRRMEQVIFASRREAREVVNSARRQQGLHQLYRDCCRLEAGCEGCVLYLAHQAGKSLAPL
ncbi:MAG: hypothetical protein AMK73_09935 [Planctomycetes bacterium SM23_32]|nr:MAG: hypothetical protein AMK73_09935 [Planctomycetes bacterium SM23_32]